MRHGTAPAPVACPGLTAAGIGAADVAAAPRKALAAAAPVAARRRRPTRTSSRPSRDVALLRRRARGLSDTRSSGRCCRSRRTRSIRIAAWRRTSASRRRAPARCTRWPPAPPGSIVASAAALLPRLAAPSGCSPRRSTSTPGIDIAPTDLGELLVDAGFTRQDPVDESRRVLRARRHRRLLPGRRRAADPARVRRRHHRVAPRLRPGDAAIDRRRSTRRRSCR